MGLDTKKPIVTRDSFTQDPFNADNLVMSAQSRSSLPTSKEDILIDKNQSVGYSFEHALMRLLQNDVFIEQYLSSAKDFVGLAASHGLLSALDEATNMKQPAQTDIYQHYLSAHLYEYHGATQLSGSVMNSSSKLTSTQQVRELSADYMLSSVDNDFVNSDMSDLDKSLLKQSFQTMQLDTGEARPASDISFNAVNTLQLSNDFLVNYEYEDSPNVYKATNYVNVAVLNKKTQNVFRQNIYEQVSLMDTLPQLTECTYIYKEWLSGFKELYIYVPTTYTFYNENKDGEDVNKNATWIQVKINGRHFKFNHIYQAHICGQSLPMQIHNEDSSISSFNDVVLPSMLRTMCISNSTTSTKSIYDSYSAQYVLYFVCYGTDAQAIRIFGD